MYSCVIALLCFALVILSEGFKSPEITQATSDTVIVQVNDTIQLNCSADGDPTPALHWIRLDSSLSDAASYNNPGELVVSDFSTTDNGLYVCAAINDYGMAVTNITTVTTNGIIIIIIIYI